MPLHVVETYPDTNETEVIDDDSLLLTSVVMRGGYEAYVIAMAEEDELFVPVYMLDAANYTTGFDPERLVIDCEDINNLYALMRPGESLTLDLEVDSGEELEMPSKITIEHHKLSVPN